MTCLEIAFKLDYCRKEDFENYSEMQRNHSNARWLLKKSLICVLCSVLCVLCFMEIFSEHFQKDHFLSKVDVRIKLVSTLVLVVMVLNYKGILFPLLVATMCFFLCLKMAIPIPVLLHRMAQPLFLAIVILLLKFFFVGDSPLFSANVFGFQITGYKDGLVEGLKIVVRILGGVSLVVVFGFTTPFTEIIAGLCWFRIPKQFIEIMIFAYRYIFVFFDEAITIYNAQKNRLGYANIRKGLRSFGVLTGTLVFRGFEQTQKITEAMIQRGYTGNIPLIIKDCPLRKNEMAWAFVIIIFGTILWMI